MYLIVNYFESENKERLNELQYCINANSNNPLFQKIILINDKDYDLSFIKFKEKILQVILLEEGKKMSYKIAIEFINKYLESEICILANTDIIFNNSIQLLNQFNLENKFIALSRYDPPNFLAKEFSQDSWMFKSPLKIDTLECNFDFGEKGCDGKIAYVMHKNGYRIINPCYSIKTIHVHKSKYRTYSKQYKIKHPYLWVLPCFINQTSKLKLKTETDLKDIHNN